MSLQEFAPQSRGQDPVSDESEIYQPRYPYSWSGKLEREAGPRDELPGNTSELRMQEGYQAQDYASSSQQQNQRTNTNYAGQQAQQQKYYSPDGDAFEQTYGPYSGYNASQSVPPWAQAQSRRRGSMRWVVFIIVGLFLLKPMLTVAALLIAAIGVAIFAFLLPLILVLGLISLFAVLLRVTFRSSRSRYRRGRVRYWRGPLGF